MAAYAARPLQFETRAPITVLKDGMRWGEDRAAGQTLDMHVSGTVQLVGNVPTLYLDIGSRSYSLFDVGLDGLSGTPFSETPQPPLRCVYLATPWSDFRVSRDTRVRFAVAEDECAEFRSDRVRDDESLVYFAGPDAKPVFQGDRFVVTGPIETAAVSYPENRRILVQARRYTKDNGSCQQ